MIQSLKISESKDKLILQPHQMRAHHEGSKQGALLGVNIYKNVKNGINEVVSGSSISISTSKNGTLQHRKLLQDQPLSTLASGTYTSPKQVKLITVML